MDRFILEIYEPGDDRTVLASLEASAPLVVAVGEVLLTGNVAPDRANQSLTITRVEHTFWVAKEGVVHKRMAFTE